jgi:hypothetical protein
MPWLLKNCLINFVAPGTVKNEQVIKKLCLFAAAFVSELQKKCITDSDQIWV